MASSHCRYCRSSSYGRGCSYSPHGAHEHSGTADRYGNYIAQTGKFVINPQFDEAGDFSEGVSLVLIGDDKTGKWGGIDKQGTFVINPQFDFAGDFSEGFALARIGDDETGKWGFIAR